MASMTLGKPPVKLIDHYIHLRPNVTAAGRFFFLPDTTLITTLRYDRAVRAPSRDDMPPDVVRRNIVELTPSLLYKPGEFGGFVEYTLRFLEEPGGRRFAHASRIGVLWDAPLDRTRRWRLPGKWQFEISYAATEVEELGDDQGLSVRVHVKTNLKQVLGREKVPPTGN